MPNLNSPEWDAAPFDGPSLTVAVPARNEAENVRATLETLLAQDYRNLRIVAVNDRSTDRTGAILDEFAAQHPERLRVLHITELPEGWLGKTHALHAAVQASESEYLLFTDADILFSSSVLRRAVAFAQSQRAAHVVVGPTPLVRSWDEGVVLGAFQAIGFWVARPWRVSDPKAKRDSVGIGAFNMLRRDALLAMGGLEPQRYAVLEDVTLGLRIKAARLPQRMAFAPGSVRVHWAARASGLIRVLTKNLFAGMNFQPVLLLAGCSALVVLFLLPLAGLLWWRTLVPSLIVMLCLAAAYRLMGRFTRIDPRYGWLYLLGVGALLWALLRSALAAWVKQGIVWRGTHYPLRELRKHNSPFVWERAARESSQPRKLT